MKKIIIILISCFLLSGCITVQVKNSEDIVRLETLVKTNQEIIDILIKKIIEMDKELKRLYNFHI